MGQQIRLTESELRNYILEAINEEMEEGFVWDTLKGFGKGVAQKGAAVADKVKGAYNAYQNDAGVASAKDNYAQMQNNMKTAKQDYRAANKTNKQISKASTKDIQYLDDMYNRYSQVNPKVAKGIKMLKSQIQSSVDMAGQAATNASNAYNTAKTNTADAKAGVSTAKAQRSQNVVNNMANKVSGQPQPQMATNEAIDAIVDKILNEMINK